MNQQSCGNMLEAGWVWICWVLSFVEQHFFVNTEIATEVAGGFCVVI